MGPKKGRRVRKIEVPTGSVPEFELGDTETDIQLRREERKAREREETQQQQQREEEARREGKSGGITLTREGPTRKKAQDKNSYTETETAGGEAGPSQSHFKKGHMTNVFLIDSDKEAIVNFVKDHEEL